MIKPEPIIRSYINIRILKFGKQYLTAHLTVELERISELEVFIAKVKLVKANNLFVLFTVSRSLTNSSFSVEGTNVKFVKRVTVVS